MRTDENEATGGNLDACRETSKVGVTAQARAYRIGNTMTNFRPYNVLSLCTGNSASIIAEAPRLDFIFTVCDNATG